MLWTIGSFVATAAIVVFIAYRKISQQPEAECYRNRDMGEIRRASILDAKGFRERQEARVQEICESYGVRPGDPAYLNVRDHAFDYLDHYSDNEIDDRCRLESMVQLEMRR